VSKAHLNVSLRAGLNEKSKFIWVALLASAWLT